MHTETVKSICIETIIHVLLSRLIIDVACREMIIDVLLSRLIIDVACGETIIDANLIIDVTRNISMIITSLIGFVYITM